MPTGGIKRVIVLGSTGSIGRQTLDVIRALHASPESPYSLEVVGLAAGRNLPLLADQVRAFHPRGVAIAREEDLSALRRRLGDRADKVEIFAGPQGFAQLLEAVPADLAVNGLVGAVGLLPTLTALERGIDVALANKESLVIGGPLVRQALAKGNARLLPIDSEHSALFQLLEGLKGEKQGEGEEREQEQERERGEGEIARAVLTASGGALRDWPRERIPQATPEDVLRHPTWAMGARITVDSATLVNKAFEVIEAHWLFGLPWERIGVVIHPQSVVHALVELVDGSLLAHLGEPDMRVPIQYALTYPQRAAHPWASLPLEGLTLEFSAWDPKRYPAFPLVVEAGQRGGTFPAVANAADEVAVERFLRREIDFGSLPRLLEAALEAHEAQAVPASTERLTLSDVLEADRWARAFAREWTLP